MDPELSAELTEDETKLYDRQIRTWGLDSQKRLRSARIVVAGMKGLGCEVAKNLVLAGVNHLVIVDHHDLSDEDLFSQFLAPQSCIGRNRAESSLMRLQALNPRVNVSVDTADIMTKDAKFFSNFDVAIITECYRKEDIEKLNLLCREANTQFFAGNVFGFFGYFFEDLGLHCYEQEIQKVLDAKKSTEASEEKTEVQILKQRMRFPTFGEVLKFNWLTKKRNLRASNSEPCFFIAMMLFEYFHKHGKRPSAKNREEALKNLKTARDIIHSNFALPENKIPEEVLPQLFSEASPVSAIVGGCLSQDVIKGITRRGEPMKNFVFYSPLTFSVRVEVIGKTKMTFPNDDGWDALPVQEESFLELDDEEDKTEVEIMSVDENPNSEIKVS